MSNVHKDTGNGTIQLNDDAEIAYTYSIRQLSGESDDDYAERVVTTRYELMAVLSELKRKLTRAKVAV